MSRRGESGFVLIAVVWLLLLGAAIAGALTLRALGTTRLAAADGEALTREMALDGAVQTALASLLFEGPRSPWAAPGAAPAVQVGPSAVELRVSSESGRLDANSVEPRLLSAALQGLAVAPEERERLVSAIEAARAERREIASASELRALLRGAGAAPPECLDDVFTVYSRMATPARGQMPDRLARALGEPAGAAAAYQAGGALRLEARLPSGGALTVVARLTGLHQSPLAVHRWEYRLDCT
jgi:hypothetical protein